MINGPINAYESAYFYTLAFPCLNYYRELFYPNGTKIVPANIGQLLTARGLAFWLQDDAAKAGKGVLIATNSYSELEVYLLMKVLKENYHLDTKIRERNPNQFSIYIRVRSMNHLRTLVGPYFVPSMLYKIGL